MAERTRFLTPSEKAGEVESFNEYRNERGHYRVHHPEARGGEGWIDPEVLPLVDTLNAIEGVCTVQSCCGHRGIGIDGTGSHPGQLWLRLSEPMARAFDDRVGYLLVEDVIEHVQKLYSYRFMEQPHEVLDIQWKADQMDEAEAVVGRFFAALWEGTRE